MKAYEIRAGFGLEALHRVERPDPTPGRQDVLLRLSAVSLNYRDLLVVKGLYNPRMALPRIPVSDGAGEVVAVGPEVTRVKVGQRVTGLFMPKWLEGEVTEAKGRSSLGGAVDGLLSELAVLHEDALVPVPEHLTDEEASTLPCAAVTAWNGLVTSGKVKPGEVVLVQGTGGVSLFALQFARLAGARVLVTSSKDDKLGRAKALGASDGINYKSNPEWSDWARQVTGGAGVDHVIEVGGAGTLPQSLKAVRYGGYIALIGVLSGSGQCSPVPILMKNVRVQGIYVGSRAMFEEMNRAIALHKLKPVVDRVFAFDQAVEAFRYMESGAHFGKVVIRVR